MQNAKFENGSASVTDAAVVYTTFPSSSAAAEVGETLVRDGLAACVNILGPMTAIYRWEGRMCRDEEQVLIIKTRASLAGLVTAAVRARHSNANPAIVVLPVVGGSADYLAWIVSETQAPAGS